MQLQILEDKTIWLDTDEGLVEEFHEIHKLLDDLTVLHSYDTRDDFCSLTIYQQKICLDEFAMNNLCCNGLYLFEYEMNYSNLGGKGCCFSANLFWK